jgi:hypothetical protein
MPTHDCRTDTAPAICVSVSGSFDGMSLDAHCSSVSFFDLTAGVPPKWIGACAEPMTGQHYGRVDVPVQGPGTFDVTLSQGDNGPGDVVVGLGEELGGNVEADNLVAARFAGAVVSSGMKQVVSGTFRASFSAPEAACSTSYADSCVATTVHGNFRFVVAAP